MKAAIYQGKENIEIGDRVYPYPRLFTVGCRAARRGLPQVGEKASVFGGELLDLVQLLH